MSESPVGPSMRGPGPVVRYLDPNSVRRRPGRHDVGPTWYLADRLLVHGDLPQSIRARLRQVDDAGGSSDVLEVAAPESEESATLVEREARRQGCRVGLEVRFRQDVEPTARSSRADLLDRVDPEFGFVLRLLTDRPDRQPDAWEVLEADADDTTTGWRLSLDHVMLAVPFTSHPFTSHPFTSHPFTSHPFTSHPFTSHPFTSHPFTSHPFTSHPFTSHGLPEYGVPGSGGRAPVQWLGSRPVRQERPDGDDARTPSGAVRPVVAIVDTGVGTHEWFGTYTGDASRDDGNGVVIRDARLPDGPIGTFPLAASPEEDAEIGGTSTAPLTGPLDPVAGHGTFIAGIVHQVCADARILPVRAVGGAGVAVESEVIESLRRLNRYHQRGLAGHAGFVPIDVVVLAMGYYHERPEDLQWDHPLSQVLATLRESGVAVVVASGNDGETRPSYPAAFAPEVDRRSDPVRITCPRDTSADRPPILSVGARNPDGTTALFSNDGPWVTCVRPGAALVSTVPTTLDGPLTPSVRMKEKYADSHRATIDPEGFQGGFATWSGTSFAAPVLAGEIARELLAVRVPRHDAGDATVEGRVRDIWDAVTAATGLELGGAAEPG